MSTDPYLLFGRLCVRANYFSADELRKAISMQFQEHKNGNEMLFGEVCIELGLITTEQRDEILRIQKAAQIMPEATVFGYIGVVNGFVSKGKIDEALRIQKGLREKNTKKKIGEILLEMKLLAPVQVQAILKAQNRLRNGMRSTEYLSRDSITKEMGINTNSKLNKGQNDSDEWSKNKLLLAGTVSNVLDEEKSQKVSNKPTIEDIQEKLRKLEEDFGGEFEISIDEDEKIEEVEIETEDLVELSETNTDFTPSDAPDTSVLRKIVAEEEIKQTSELFRENIKKNQNLPEFQEKTQIVSNKSKFTSPADIPELKDPNDFDEFISSHDTDYLATQIVVESPTNEPIIKKNSKASKDKLINETSLQKDTKKNGQRKLSKAPKVKKETSVVLDSIDLKPVEEIEYQGIQQKTKNKRKSKSVAKPGENKFRGRLQTGQIDVKFKKEYPVKKILLITAIILSIFLAFILSTLLFNS